MSITRIIAGRDGPIISCSAGDSVLHASSLLAEGRVGALPVLDGESVCGVFSERDLLYCVARDGAAALEHIVGDVMTSPAITIAPDADALHALSMMSRRRIRHLPVVKDGRMVAFVSIGDLVKYRMDIIEAEAEQMRDYISMA